MSRSQLPLYLGLTAAGGVGYYMYQAGGRPKVAEKRFESDMHKAAASVKSELPGRGAGAEKEGKKVGQEAGAKFDEAVATVDRNVSRAKSDAEAYAKGVKADTMQKIDETDRKIEESAAKAKSGISSWFGGK